MDPSAGPDGLEIVLVCKDDVVFAPHTENADRCDAGGVQLRKQGGRGECFARRVVVAQ